MRHRSAGRLLAVAQSGVENLDLLQFNVGHDLSPSVRRMAFRFLLWQSSPKHPRAMRSRAIRRLGAAKKKQKRVRRTEGRTGYRNRAQGDAGGNFPPRLSAV